MFCVMHLGESGESELTGFGLTQKCRYAGIVTTFLLLQYWAQT